ncbi:MAG: alanine--tRNA ligase, partial [Bacteroidales bacterium]|nr:alanine--tRNA ligase [Bacteroidales bacterium]
IAEAKAMGAMALFGEKYGDKVRVVEFGDSIELCGVTHTDSTATIGMIKITSEGAIATGIRRIEAITANKVEEYVNGKIDTLDEINALMKNPSNITDSLNRLIEENNAMKKTIEKFEAKKAADIFDKLYSNAKDLNGIHFVKAIIKADSAETLKSVAFEARKNSEDTILVLGADINGRASIFAMVSDALVKAKKCPDAVAIIKEISKEINGGGGGQPFLASAGGKNVAGLQSALDKAEKFIKENL